MEESIPELTQEEQQALMDAGYGGTTQDLKHNVHEFLHNVAIATDTTKLGFLKEEEVGIPKLPQRSLKELALFCDKVWEQPAWKEFFEAQSEILTSTSLSKEAKLLELAVVTRREVADVTKKPRKENPSWFKRKSPSPTPDY